MRAASSFVIHLRHGGVAKNGHAAGMRNERPTRRDEGRKRGMLLIHDTLLRVGRPSRSGSHRSRRPRHVPARVSFSGFPVLRQSAD